MRLEQIPGVVDLRSSIGLAGAEMRFRPMQEALDFYQISQSDLAGQMVAYMENEKHLPNTGGQAFEMIWRYV